VTLDYQNEEGATFTLYQYEGTAPTVPDELRMVGQSPIGVMCSDRDAEAMDVTNWDAMLSTLDDDDRADNLSDMVKHGAGDWYVATWQDPAIDRKDWHSLCSSGALIVRQGTESWDAWLDAARSLQDYPLLDEDAYSELDWNAWSEYVTSGDLMRDVWRDDAMPRRQYIDGTWQTRTVPTVADVADMILADVLPADVEPWEWRDDMADDIGPAIAMQLDYWSGLTGEYDSEGAARLALDYIGGCIALVSMLARAGNDWHMAAMGHVRLPMD